MLQTVAILGVDEGRDPKTCPLGTLVRGVNVQMDKARRVLKRWGTRGLAKTGAPFLARRFILRGSEICITDGYSLYAWNAATATWTNQGAISECGLTWTTLQDPIDGAEWSDICLIGQNRMVRAWLNGDATSALGSAGTLWYEIVDRTTGQRTTPPTQVLASPNAGAAARLVTDGTNWVLVFGDASSDIKCIVNGGAVRTLFASAATPVGLDACVIGTNFVVAWTTNTANLQLTSYDFSDPPVAQQPTTTIAAVVGNAAPVSIDGRAGETLYVAWTERGGSTTKIKGVDPVTFAQTFAAVTLDSTTVADAIGVARLTAGSAYVAYSLTTSAAGSASVGGVTVGSVVSSAGAISATRKSVHAVLLTRPFVLNGIAYMFLADYGTAPALKNLGGTGNNPNAGTTNPAYTGANSYLVEAEQTTAPAGYPHRLVGLVDVLIAGRWITGTLANVAAVSETEALAPLPFQSEAPRKPTNWRQGVRLVDVTIGASVPAGLWSSTQFGGEAHITAGYFTAYDGRRPFDYGFARPTRIDQFSSSMAGAGGSLAAGNYIYSMYPSFHSAAGLEHRGPTSTPWTFAAAASDKMTLKYLPQSLCWKGTKDSASPSAEPLRVYNVIYRTVVNGSTLQRVTQLPLTNASANDPTSQPTSFVDGTADATIPLAPQLVLYVTEELDDYPPPASITQVKYRNRHVVVDGSRRLLWISKDFSANPSTAPGFHPTQVIPFTEDIIGLSTLDDRLIVFSDASVWLLAGDGPAPDGTGSDYGSPLRLQIDAGCINPRSIVSTDEGVFFQSARGLMLLDRKLNVQWIGRNVMDTLAAFPTITSAVAVPASHEVRFTANAADGATGVMMVYDYAASAWFTRQYTDASDSLAASMPIADACLAPDGTYLMVTPNAQVYAEDRTTSLDGGSAWVTEDVELADAFSDGPLGYQRVRRVALLGDRMSDCDARVRIAVNGKAIYGQDHTTTSDVVATEGVNLTRVVKVQKNGSIRVRFTDATPTAAAGSGYVPAVGTGAGVTLSAIAFEIEPIEGINRRPAKAVA